MTKKTMKKSVPQDPSPVITQAKHLVAIDLGSNSFHLIIAREQDGCLQILHRQKQSIGLAAGLNDDSCLSEEVIDKALNCLREFNLSLTSLPSSAIRIVATHALRDAANIDYFKSRAGDVIPYPIEVISGKLEAELIYKGVAHTQPLRGTTFIIDIGGGSTELVIGHNFSTSLTDSLSMGCISFQQRFFLHGDINAKAMHDAQAFATKQLAGIADKYRKSKSRSSKGSSVLGTSGSIKVISQVMLELYGDGKITKKRLKRLVKQLIIWQHCDNIPLRSIEESRRALLAGAVAILSSCFEQLDIEQMKFSLGGLREGVLYDLSQSRTDIDTRERTIHNLMKLYHVDQAFNQRVLQQVTLLKQQLQETPAQLNRTEFTLLCWAAQLHEIGIAINSKKRQRHGAYIVEHSDMPGFSESERTIISLLILNHRGKINIAPDLQGSIDTQPTLSTPRIQLLMQILRLAIISTQGRKQAQEEPLTINYYDEKDKAYLKVMLGNQIELREKLNVEATKQANLGLTLLVS